MEYRNGILEAGRIVLSHDKLNLIEMAVKFKSTRSIMAANYYECLRAGLNRIENEPEAYRRALWEQAKEIGEGLTRPELIELCRCIHWYENMKG